MSISGTWAPATVPFEIEANMYTYITSRTSETSALMHVELGGNRSTQVQVHSVPNELVEKAIQDMRVERPVTIGVYSAEDGPISVLTRVRIGATEYHLTS